MYVFLTKCGLETSWVTKLLSDHVVCDPRISHMVWAEQSLQIWTSFKQSSQDMIRVTAADAEGYVALVTVVVVDVLYKVPK